MNIIESVERFFRAYEDDWQSRWSSDQDLGRDEPDEIPSRLLRPGLPSRILTDTVALGLAGPLPVAVFELFSRAQCQAWELPWGISLMSTPGLRSVEAFRSRAVVNSSAGKRVVVAYSEWSDLDFFVFDEPGSRDDAPIHAQGDDGRLFTNMFGSVTRMIQVLAAAIPLAPAAGIEELKVIDPEGFGGMQWPYWSRILAREDSFAVKIGLPRRR